MLGSKFRALAALGATLILSVAPVGGAGAVQIDNTAAAPIRVRDVPNWTGTSPFVDDATAVAVSPSFDSDHTVLAGVSYRINEGQPFVQAVASVQQSTDGGATWRTTWSNTSPSGTILDTLNQIVISPNFATDRTVFALWDGPNGGGVIRSTDGGASFQPANLGTTLFSGTSKTLSISPTFGADRTIAVTADASTTATSFLSTDGGSTWRVVAPSVPDSCAGSLTGGGFLLVLGGGVLGSYVNNNGGICTTNSDFVYVSSHDNGQTWSRHGDIQAAIGNGNNSDQEHSRMYAAPSGGVILYTDQYGNVVRSTDSGTNWQSLIASSATLGHDNPPGSVAGFGPYYTFKFESPSSIYAVHEWTRMSYPHIFHSADGGATWNIFWQGNGATAQHDVTPAGSHTVFLAAGNEGLLRTTDLGQTWQSVGKFLGQHSAVALSPAFASDHSAFTVTFPGALPTGGQDPDAFGVYRSSNGGATWSEPEAPNPFVDSQFGTIFTTSSGGGLSLAVSPNFTNDHTVFEGDRLGAISISHDGGRTWTVSLPGTPPQEGWFVNALAFSPNYANDRVVYWGGGPGGFGLFKSVDGGQTWVQVTPADRIDELAAAELHDIAISPEPSGRLDMAISMSHVFLAQDTPASTARQEWVDAGLVTGGPLAMSPAYQTDCTIYASMWPGPSGIGATLDDGVYVSHNACMSQALAGRVTWTRLTGSLPVRDFSAIALSPNFATDYTLFIGSYTSGVFMSNDGGQTWSNMSSGLTNTTVHKLAVAATGPQAGSLFAATDGGVWETPVSLVAGALPPPPLAQTPAQTLMAPQRLVDTRSSGGAIASGASRCFQIAGLGGIPSDATSVVLNVAAAGYGTRGWLTLYPNGQPVPTTSTLNFDPNEYAIANGTVMRLGTNGQVCVSVGTINSAPGSSHVILDATGFLSASALTQLPMLASPVRVADTRTSGGAIPTGQSRCFIVAGVAGVPADAAAVVLNVTAASYSTRGWLTVYPNGQPVPATSTLNFDTGEYAIANGTIMRVGSGGQVCVSVGTINSAPGDSQAILDVTGYVSTAGLVNLPMLSSPERLADTRTSGGPIQTGASRCFSLAGQAGIPANAASIVVNVTAVGYATRGWLTVYPNGQAVPATSTVNFDPSEYAMANGTIIAVGANGQVCVNVGTINGVPGSANVLLDVVGYVTQ